MRNVEHKNFEKPDETRTFEKGKIELLNIGGGVVGRTVFQPGWRWSLHVKPVAKTDWCEAPHFAHVVSGRMHVRMADGPEFDVGPGEVFSLPAKHDAWVLGNEPVVAVDWEGAMNYAKR